MKGWQCESMTELLQAARVSQHRKFDKIKQKIVFFLKALLQIAWKFLISLKAVITLNSVFC